LWLLAVEINEKRGHRLILHGDRIDKAWSCRSYLMFIMSLSNSIDHTDRSHWATRYCHVDLGSNPIIVDTVCPHFAL